MTRGEIGRINGVGEGGFGGDAFEYVVDLGAGWTAGGVFGDGFGDTSCDVERARMQSVVLSVLLMEVKMMKKSYGRQAIGMVKVEILSSKKKKK
eukprot:scaffold37723_cov189-Skeletonema_marinoi.AAC.6